MNEGKCEACISGKHGVTARANFDYDLHNLITGSVRMYNGSLDVDKYYQTYKLFIDRWAPK